MDFNVVLCLGIQDTIYIYQNILGTHQKLVFLIIFKSIREDVFVRLANGVNILRNINSLTRTHLAELRAVGKHFDARVATRTANNHALG